jgi:serine/threonine-protein kinase
VEVLAPGELVRDDLEIVRLLGRGAMGEVWVARNRRLDTEVAVKFVSSDLGAQTTEAAARFGREARAAAQIKSLHIMQVFDTGVTAAGMPFIVMELCEGETLRERLDREGKLGLADVRILVSQIVKGLEAAHRADIVHRDIKPDNVFLSTMGEELVVKLFDFGIAKRAEETMGKRLTLQGILVGTPEYMSPEQIMDSRSVDLRADLWALGVMVYELLTGELPFKGDDIGALCGAILRGTYRPARELRPELPDGVDAWLARAFRRAASERFGSALEMGRAFLRESRASSGTLDEAVLASDAFAAVPAEAVPSAADTLRGGTPPMLAGSSPTSASSVTLSGSTADQLVAPFLAARRRRLMAVGASLLTVVTAVVLWLALRAPSSATAIPTEASGASARETALAPAVAAAAPAASSSAADPSARVGRAAAAIDIVDPSIAAPTRVPGLPAPVKEPPARSTAVPPRPPHAAAPARTAPRLPPTKRSPKLHDVDPGI